MATNQFASRHIGSDTGDINFMLQKLGLNSLDELIEQTIPRGIMLNKPLGIREGLGEHEYLELIQQIASRNKIFKSYIGMGYYNTTTPSVIIRNVLENPAWYTPYTPYQAEISQGRLEALLNFQTMIAGITSMEVANASLLDEASAGAEALTTMYNTRLAPQVKNNIDTCIINEAIWPQTRAVIETRAAGLGIRLEFKPLSEIKYDPLVHFGLILQYPDANGEVHDYREIIKIVKDSGGKVAVAADLLALTLIVPPGEWDADIVFGSCQRFGLPMAYGGPHAAYFSCREELKREIPGRIIGVSKDANGRRALRMALQTREQHIKRERATSNICTSQALMAAMAGFYAIYHGPGGLTRIARGVHQSTASLAEAMENIGITRENQCFFDTLVLNLEDKTLIEKLRATTLENGINLRYIGNSKIGISLDETTTVNDLEQLVSIISTATGKKNQGVKLNSSSYIPVNLSRKSRFMEQEVFNTYRSESAMARYIKQLERKDISLVDSMIPLGSCTMKLNPSTAMFPVTWPGFAAIHPFVPPGQAEGYHFMMKELADDLAHVTGLPGISFQPTSGATGEYAGLMAIKSYHEKLGQGHRDIALIPTSAHGTNPASAVMAGLKVVSVKCDQSGGIDVDDLIGKASLHRSNLACLMVTYPSTHGVFEPKIQEICQVVHENGGQVYMDGANMNAQVGLTNPAITGADICHLNLHKTFAIPHGGGGPGAGPVAAAAHLTPYLPGHPMLAEYKQCITVSAAPWGNAGILPITYGYIKMMGGDGLTLASKIAILNANYIASQLKDDYGILFTGNNGRVAHELIVECRHFKAITGITEVDIAKRLMDYGFHAPTLSFPVPGTLMVEPTESEPLKELNRFIEAMRAIRAEIAEVENNIASKNDNPLKNAPHPAYVVAASSWPHAYTRQKAAFPIAGMEENKYWPPVARVDDAHGDRNLICTCNPATGES